jgi:adenylate cyclase
MAKASSNSNNDRGRRAFALLVGILLAAMAGWFLQSFRPGEKLRQRSYDSLLVIRGEVRATEAVVVYLDEKSHQVLGQPQNKPWSRKLHAQLVDRLTRAGARAIVFDIVFSDPDPDGDPLLAEAMKRHGKVILAADRRDIAGVGTKFDPPCPALLDVVADIGSVERWPDSDLMVRRHTLRHPDEQVGVLSWVTAQALEAPITAMPGEELKPRWLNYYGMPNILPRMSYYEVMIDAPEDVDLGVSNKVVFVGSKIITKFAGDRKDEFPSPFSSFDRLPVFMAGVEIQATEFLNLLRQDSLRRVAPRIETGLVILFGVLVGAGLVFMRPLPATFTALAAGLAVAGISALFFSRKLIWFPWLILLVQIALALGWSVLFNSVQLYVQKRLFEFTLGLYLSPKLVKKFSDSPEMLKPGAEKQLLTFMFSDIADFTSISEGMDGDELAGMMNDYFQPAVANCIHKTEGTVVKYIGDAIFALWNAPEIQLDHAERACEAALYFRDLSKQPVRGRKLHTRIGLHTGVANVGNFGSEDRVDYTAIGESVNLASRMEGLNKYLGTDCLISGATKQHISDRFVTRRIGLFQLKGFEGLVEVHELVGFKEQVEATQAWREAFREALENFEQRNIVFAELGFRRVLELKPDDGPSMHYLKRIEEVNAEEVPDTWATHTILKDK